jgi:hypothetical protein
MFGGVAKSGFASFPTSPLLSELLKPAWDPAKATLSTGFVSSSRAVSSSKWGGVAEPIAREAMRLAAQKLPIKVKFVTKADFEKPEPAQATASEVATSSV